jgi:hypothetical protein
MWSCQYFTPLCLFVCRSCFTKAEELRQKHEEVLANRVEHGTANASQGGKTSTESNSSEEDETDFDELLNWRAKIS